VTISKAGAPNGDAQTAEVATELPESLRVVVQEDGLPKPVAVVNWTSTATAAVLDPTSSVTDANGLTATSWTLGHTAGGQTARATLSGAGGSPVSFTATASPGPAAALTIQGGNNQQPIVTSALAPLSVVVADAFGNGRTGETVAWSVTSGTLTLSAAQSTSGAGGVATIGATAAATVGAVSVRALVLDVDTVTFNLTAVLPSTATVHAPGISYRSARNLSTNPAVDTVGVNATVTWDQLGNGAHRVRSTGATSFIDQGATNSPTFQATFGTAGVYTYDCDVHGQNMTGRVVVLP
jgi:plastocyanin